MPKSNDRVAQILRSLRPAVSANSYTPDAIKGFTGDRELFGLWCVFVWPMMLCCGIQQRKPQFDTEISLPPHDAARKDFIHFALMGKIYSYMSHDNILLLAREEVRSSKRSSFCKYYIFHKPERAREHGCTRSRSDQSANCICNEHIN